MVPTVLSLDLLTTVVRKKTFANSYPTITLGKNFEFLIDKRKFRRQWQLKKVFIFHNALP